MKKLGPIMLMVCGGCLLALAMTSASADSKSEMVGIMDKLGDNQPGSEGLVDWDHLVIHTPQTKHTDIPKLYRSMDAKNKREFRTEFLRSFAASFRQSSRGHKFADVAKKKGAITVVESATHPILILHQPDGRSDLRVLFIRKNRKLLFQGMETKG